jgi:phosphopantothenoylcysteine synthetase/decarboxylase
MNSMPFQPEIQPEQAPELGVSRLLLVVTGSAGATGMPSWTSWLSLAYPRLTTRLVLTRSAQRFVTRQALAPRVSEVLVDTWPEDDLGARHVEMSEWAEAIIVYPATLHFVARLALGLADTPALLAAQCATCPIAVAPSLPPGGMDSAAFRAHWTALVDRPNVAVAPPIPAMSLTTGKPDAWGPPPLSEVIEMLERRRKEIAGSSSEQTATYSPDGVGA